MKDITKKFVEHKIKVYGEDVWALLFCDNLSAHLDPDVKEIFGNGKVFLCFLPPNMTNFIQPIDAVFRRSVHIAIGIFLDEWLMDPENMECWESKWTASERHVLITDLVGKAMEFVMGSNNDGNCVGCLTSIICLFTRLHSKEFNSKISAQGMPVGKFCIPTQQQQNVASEVMNKVIQPQSEEEVVLEEEQRFIDNKQ